MNKLTVLSVLFSFIFQTSCSPTKPGNPREGQVDAYVTFALLNSEEPQTGTDPTEGATVGFDGTATTLGFASHGDPPFVKVSLCVGKLSLDLLHSESGINQTYVDHEFVEGPLSLNTGFNDTTKADVTALVSGLVIQRSEIRMKNSFCGYSVTVENNSGTYVVQQALEIVQNSNVTVEDGLVFKYYVRSLLTALREATSTDEVVNAFMEFNDGR